MYKTNVSYLRWMEYNTDGAWKTKYNRYTNPKKFEKKTRTIIFNDRVDVCAGPMKSMQDKASITVFLPVSAVRSEEFLIKWIDYINELGFPCKYMGKSPKKVSNLKMFAVNVYPHNYPDKGKHLLAVHSLIRYGYSERYYKISYHAINLHEKTGLNKWKCLYLAHYAQGKRYKGYYGLLPSKGVKKPTLFYFPPDYVGIMDKLYDTSINKSFQNEITKKFPNLSFKEKNYDKIIKALGL